jgi:hypothetical protein
VSEEKEAEPSEPAKRADRFYGAFLILLAIASAVAPLFAEATLAWTLLLAGLIGISWLALDRTPRGFLAAVGWSLVAFGLGLHLVFHVLLNVISLDLTLGLGFIILGAAEILFGFERYPGRQARAGAGRRGGYCVRRRHPASLAGNSQLGGRGNYGLDVRGLRDRA